MISQAFAPTLIKASPGGHISAFCEAETTISIPHSSCRSSRPPSPLTESTMRSVGESRTTRPIAAKSATTAVELSLCTTTTARYSPAGGSLLNDCWINGLPPRSLENIDVRAQRLRDHREALPELTAHAYENALSGSQDVRRDLPPSPPSPNSRAGVLGFAVPKIGFNNSCVRVKIARNSGPRWFSTVCANHLSNALRDCRWARQAESIGTGRGSPPVWRSGHILRSLKSPYRRKYGTSPPASRISSMIRGNPPAAMTSPVVRL